MPTAGSECGSLSAALQSGDVAQSFPAALLASLLNALACVLRTGV